MRLRDNVGRSRSCGSRYLSACASIAPGGGWHTGITGCPQATLRGQGVLVIRGVSPQSGCEQLGRSPGLSTGVPTAPRVPGRRPDRARPHGPLYRSVRHRARPLSGQRRPWLGRKRPVCGHRSRRIRLWLPFSCACSRTVPERMQPDGNETRAAPSRIRRRSVTAPATHRAPHTVAPTTSTTSLATSPRAAVARTRRARGTSRSHARARTAARRDSQVRT